MRQSSPVVCDFVLRGARELVTMAGDDALGIVEGGALLAREGRILWVGREGDLERAADDSGALIQIADDAVAVDAAGACVLPGFVDAHTHAVFAGSRAGEYEERLQGRSYEDILASGGGINRTVAATRDASPAVLAELTRRRLDSFVRHGTTTVEIKSGYGLDLETERRMFDAAAVAHPARRVLTFLGAHFVPAEFVDRADEYIELVCEEMLPALHGVAESVDVFCDVGAFTVEQSRRVLLRARELGYSTKIHADELARSGGALLAAEVGCVSADHLVHATWEEIAALKQANVVAVVLPGTSFSLGSAYAPARDFIDAGLALALATDFNPGTSYCENMQMVIALACQQMRLTVAEALRAATMGGAAALGRAHELGSLAPGKSCDLIVLAAETHAELPYHFGVNLVDGVVIGGRPVVIDAGSVIAAEAAVGGGASALREEAG
jgi:imidazolonepropionase